jgi:hypothetical protein
MIWTYGKKYNGWDVNKVPTNYLEWAVNNAENSEMKEAAMKVLNFRASRGDGNVGTPANQSRTQPGEQYKGSHTAKTDPMLLRAVTLLCAVTMDPMNPWKELDHAIKYIGFGQTPTLSQVLTEPEPKAGFVGTEPKQEEQFLSELADDVFPS